MAALKEKKENKVERVKNGITEIVFIIDKSGSMSGLEDDTIGGFNSFIEKQRAEDGTAYVTTVMFSTDYVTVHDRVDISTVEPLTAEDYRVGGGTALYDALGDAIKHITDVHKYIRPEDVPEKTIFVITTDGMENASRRYDYHRVKEMIERQKERHGWEFVFLGANIDAAKEAARFGIDADRAANYHADRRGTGVVYEAMNQLVSCCRAERPLDSNWRSGIDADYDSRR